MSRRKVVCPSASACIGGSKTKSILRPPAMWFNLTRTKPEARPPTLMVKIDPRTRFALYAAACLWPPTGRFGAAQRGSVSDKTIHFVACGIWLALFRLGSPVGTTSSPDSRAVLQTKPFCDPCSQPSRLVDGRGGQRIGIVRAALGWCPADTKHVTKWVWAILSVACFGLAG